MSLALPLNEDQRDCLQEITNVAMGAAAGSLANFTDTFVNLPIPIIRCVNSEHLIDSLRQVEGYNRLSSISQLFKFSGLNCYALIVINDESIDDLARFTGRSLDDDEGIKNLLYDLCQTINTTCFERLGEMIENAVETDSPIVNSLHVPLDSVQMESIANSDHLVSVEINYHIENNPFNCDLLLLFPEDTLEELTQVLNNLM
ncbi:MAG: chemotaxis protein CheY-P-specific phosphatase CheC [Granulosicoccus sp.]|jgi:chemotaxis protein CheY-P-specific phosphatase CheC